MAAPGHVAGAHLLRLRDDRLAAAARATTRTAPDPRATPGSRPPGSRVTSVIVLCLAAFGTYELVTARARARARARPRSGTRRGSQAACGAGHRAAVAVHLPLPAVRRVRDDPADAAGQPVGPVQRDLAGRHPQLLGLPARREGRRQPRRQQRRLHQAHAPRPGHRALRRAVRPAGTARCSTTATFCPTRTSWPGPAGRECSSPRRPRSCRLTRRPTIRPSSRPSTRPWSRAVSPERPACYYPPQDPYQP